MKDRDEHLVWKDVSSRLIKRCGIFDLYESQRRTQNGRQGVFHLLTAPDWVNVVPLLTDERGRSCFLMVRQFRQGISSITVEFPAGLVEPGETPERAAERELLEETGYRSQSLQPIGTIVPNPAFMNNRCHTFLAEDLSRHAPAGGEHGPDELELLDVLLVPVDTLLARIGRRPYCNSMTALALYWYQRGIREEGETGADRSRTGV
ncbi:MAG: NUDIX hydrolase [Spirochaetales bacterium]|nr:NUDIX hydrolase [Spirochaetales bacterium]